MTLDELKLRVLAAIATTNRRVGAEAEDPSLREAVMALPDRTLFERLAPVALDLSGARLFCVRVALPSLPDRTLVVMIRVEDADVDRVASRATQEGMTREETFRAVAIDSVRMNLHRNGFSIDELMGARASVEEVSAEFAAAAIIRCRTGG
jgi:hypothetical protein